jgi:hypothetical protein
MTIAELTGRLNKNLSIEDRVECLLERSKLYEADNKLLESAMDCKEVLSIDKNNIDAQTKLRGFDKNPKLLIQSLLKSIDHEHDAETKNSLLNKLLTFNIDTPTAFSLIQKFTGDKGAIIRIANNTLKRKEDFLNILGLLENNSDGLLVVLEFLKRYKSLDIADQVYSFVQNIWSDTVFAIFFELAKMENNHTQVISNDSLLRDLASQLSQREEVALLFFQFIPSLNEKQYKKLVKALDDQLGNMLHRPDGEIISFIDNCFKIDNSIGSKMFQSPGIVSSIIDTVEMESIETRRAFLVMLNLACNDKASRACIHSDCLQFLLQSMKSTDPKLESLSRLIITKLLLDQKQVKVELDDLFDYFKNGVSVKELSTISVEGISYLSSLAEFKSRIADDSALLRRLSEKMEDSYGFTTIVYNLIKRRDALSEEQKSMLEVKKFAKDIQLDVIKEYNHPEHDDEAVEKRTKLIMRFDVLSAFLKVLKTSTTDAIKEKIANALCNISSNEEYRVQIIRVLGLRNLHTKLFTCFKEPNKEQKQIQMKYSHMLAKILITTNPGIIFKNDDFSLDLVKPLLLLIKEASHELEEYEALLALTNLSSLSGELQEKIVTLKGLSILQSSQHSSNDMIQCAATECLSNLMMNADVLEWYLPKQDFNNLEEYDRLKIFAALLNSDGEVKERISVATSGVFAMLLSFTNDDIKRNLSLYLTKYKVIEHFESLLLEFPRNLGLIHRILVCVNEMKRHGNVERLNPLIKKMVFKGENEISQLQKAIIN